MSNAKPAPRPKQPVEYETGKTAQKRFLTAMRGILTVKKTKTKKVA